MKALEQAVNTAPHYDPFTGEQGIVDVSYPVGHVKRYGAIGDGNHDDTSAIQQALTNATRLGWGEITFGRGTFLVTSTLTMAGHRLHLVGAGRYVTQLLFRPATASACIRVQYSDPTLVSYQCSIQHLSFLGHSAATAIQKIAIDAWDTSGLYVHDVTVQNWTGNSGSSLTPSTGFRSNGREATTVFFVEFACDRPFWIRANPNSPSLDADSFTFLDCYCIVQGATESSYEIDSQVGLYNLTIGGRQNWVQGKYGVHWASSGTMRGTAQNIHIAAGRFEQATDATGYGVYWTGGTNNLLLTNVNAGGITNTNGGFYLRNTVFPTLIGCAYTDTAGQALNVDGTAIGVNTLEWRNCTWQVGSTATLTAMQPILTSPQYVAGTPLPPSATYVSTTNTLPAVKITGSATDLKEGTLANGGTVTLNLSFTTNVTVAIVDVVACEVGGTSKREGASFVVGGTGATKMSGTANTTVGNVAGNLCLLWNSISSIQVLNNLGVSVEYVIRTVYRPS